MHIATIVGSVRAQNASSNAARIANDQFKQTNGLELSYIDPTPLKLVLPGQETQSDDQKQMQSIVKSADGVLLITPEYHGSYSSTMKLVIDNLGFPSALKGKPIALLGVAAGRIGAIKALEHLRSVASHVGGLVLPGAVSIANVRAVFDEQGACKDPAVEQQIRKLADSLVAYVRSHVCALASMEEQLRKTAAA